MLTQTLRDAPQTCRAGPGRAGPATMVSQKKLNKADTGRAGLAAARPASAPNNKPTEGDQSILSGLVTALAQCDGTEARMETAAATMRCGLPAPPLSLPPRPHPPAIDAAVSILASTGHDACTAGDSEGLGERDP